MKNEFTKQERAAHLTGKQFDNLRSAGTSCSSVHLDTNMKIIQLHRKWTDHQLKGIQIIGPYILLDFGNPTFFEYEEKNRLCRPTLNQVLGRGWLQRGWPSSWAAGQAFKKPIYQNGLINPLLGWTWRCCDEQTPDHTRPSRPCRVSTVSESPGSHFTIITTFGMKLRTAQCRYIARFYLFTFSVILPTVSAHHGG